MKKGSNKMLLKGIMSLTALSVFLSFGCADQTDSQAVSKPLEKPPVEISDNGIVEEEVPEVIPQEADWRLRLVNQENPLPADFTIETKKLSNGKEFDARAYDDLVAMVEAAKVDGVSLIVGSAYRTIEYQQGLFDRKINQYKAKGYDDQGAYDIAKTIVAIPGTSEHNLGLAADIVTNNYQTLDSGFENTEAFKWLDAHATEYGFILRYPKDKSEVTGIIYEPWHYRYVGHEAAVEIKAQGVCLEEYLNGV